MRLTAKEAHYALEVLLDQGKLREAQVRAALRRRREEIEHLRKRLAALEAGGPANSARRRARRAVRRAKLSPRVRKLRRLQGRYMGYVRRLNAAQKAKVRAAREKSGMLSAIRLAASFARREP